MTMYFDVTDPKFGAKGDGISSDSQAIQSAIDAALAAFPKQLTGELPWPEVAAIVRFPVVETAGNQAGFYVLHKPLHINPGVSLALVGDASHGALLMYTGSGPALTIEGGDGTHAVSIERMSFQGGGVLIRGRHSVGVSLRDTAFYCTKGWALQSSGDVGWVRISNCHVTECGSKETGGIKIGAGAHDWDISSTAFVRNGGRGVWVRGRDVRLTDCDFNTKPVGSKDSPFVHVEAPAQRFRLQSSRFGNEDGLMADDACVIGPLVAVGSSECILDVRIDKCDFRGDDINSTTPIRISAPVSGLRIDHCTATGVMAAFIHEEIVGLAFPFEPQDVMKEIATSRCRDNFVSALYAANWLATTPMFSHGGHAFEIQGRTARALAPGNAVGGAGGNLLRWTESLLASVGDVSPWLWSTLDPTFPLQPELSPTTKTISIAASPTATNPGPPGSSWAVWDVTGSGGAGTWCIAQPVNGVAQASVQAGPLVFSVWLQGDLTSEVDPRPVRLEIRALDAEFAALSASAVVTLRPRWMRHAVVAEGLPAEKPVMVVVYHGDGLSSWQGSFRLAMPQLEMGRTPSEYQPVGEIPLVRTDRPMGARMIRGVQVHFGQLPPKNLTNYRFEVGDRILSDRSTTADGAGPVGWVCVVAGSPGTWRELEKAK